MLSGISFFGSSYLVSCIRLWITWWVVFRLPYWKLRSNTLLKFLLLLQHLRKSFGRRYDWLLLNFLPFRKLCLSTLILPSNIFFLFMNFDIIIFLPRFTFPLISFITKSILRFISKSIVRSITKSILRRFSHIFIISLLFLPFFLEILDIDGRL